MPSQGTLSGTYDQRLLCIDLARVGELLLAEPMFVKMRGLYVRVDMTHAAKTALLLARTFFNIN
jgi:hypothetical protein